MRPTIQRIGLAAGFILATLWSVPGFAQSIAFTKIADMDTVVPPGDTDTFFGFATPSIDGMNVAFLGSTAPRRGGVYLSADGTLIRIADRTFTAPNGDPQPDFFRSFFSPLSIDGETVAFLAGSATVASGVYTGSGGPLQAVADTTFDIPEGIGNFRGFAFFPAHHAGMTVFIGHDAGVAQQIGVYKGVPDAPLIVVANQDTLMPSTDPAMDRILTFGCPGTTCAATVAFRDPVIEGQKIVFVGAGGNDGIIELGGIYEWVGGELDVVVDTKTPVPGTTNRFDGFSSLSLDEGRLAFSGVGGGVLGIYTVVDGTVELVADTTTPIPDGVANFQHVARPSTDNGNVAFIGQAATQQGIYLKPADGPLTKVIDKTDLLDGKQIERLHFGTEGLSGNLIAFMVDFVREPGQEVTPRAIFVAEIPGLNREPLTLNAQKDSFLAGIRRNKNDGANSRLVVGGFGRNRPVVAFDAGTIAAFLNDGDLSAATLVLSIAENLGNWGFDGRNVEARPLLEEFTEGNGHFFNMPRVNRIRGDGPGVTWNCATDADIANVRRDCTEPWNGGNVGPATAAPVMHFNNQGGEVSWDVTDDVLDGANAWLVGKSQERRPGRVNYYSKEGAEDAEDLDLAPRLILVP